MHSPYVDFNAVVLSPDSTLLSALDSMTASDIGIILVADDERRLLGVVVDGDIRRTLIKSPDLNQPLRTMMTSKPRTASINTPEPDLADMAESALSPWLPLTDDDGVIRGLVNLNLLRRQGARLPNAAVLMAGGRGERLRPFTESTPKPMMTVGEKPLLETLMQTLKRHGFSRFYLSVNYLADQIEAYFGDGSNLDVEIEYLRESQPLGTAGSLQPLGNIETDPVFVINGDVLTRVNPHAMLEFHRQENASATMAVREYHIEIPYGVVESSQNHLRRLREKPVHKVFINAGIYVLEPAVFRSIPEDEHVDMPDVLNRLAQESDRPVACFPVPEYWVDIGNIDDLRRAREDFTVTFDAG